MSDALNQQDLTFLGLALNEAEKALPLSHPNPAVGCVIVSPSGQVIATGHTQPAGGLHAEAMALQSAAQQGVSLAGASVYVTLEPCAHHGRTPPCATALVNAKVARVVTLLQDPNPLVAGGGLVTLQKAGIKTALLGGETSEKQALLHRAEDQMRGFLQRMRHGKPWVRLKAAASLDGFTALPDGQSQWITGPDARRDTHHWRARVGFIVTGIGTILADQPRLDVRGLEREGSAPPHQPSLVILDRQLRTPLPSEWGDGIAATQNFWSTLQNRACLIFCDARAYEAQEHQARIAALHSQGAEVIALQSVGNPLLQVRNTLFERGANEIHIEAGAELSGAWVHARLVDELLLYLAPKLLASGKPLLNLPALQSLNAAQTLHIQELSQIGDDVRIRSQFHPPSKS